MSVETLKKPLFDMVSFAIAEGSTVLTIAEAAKLYRLWGELWGHDDDRWMLKYGVSLSDLHAEHLDGIRYMTRDFTYQQAKEAFFSFADQEYHPGLKVIRKWLVKHYG